MALRTLRSLTRRSSSTFASLNGVPPPAASLKCSLWDVTFQRGDGVCEAVRVVQDRDGVPAPRAVSLHLDRLERSAAALELKLPPRAHLESWLRDVPLHTYQRRPHNRDHEHIISRGVLSLWSIALRTRGQ